MVPWWKRLIYSFISALIGGSVVGAIASCRDALREGHLDPGRVLLSTCIVLVASLPGWFVAIPIVVVVKTYNGWRLWACAVAGVCIGPALILGLAVYSFLTDPRASGFAQGSSVFLVLSSAVSILATTLYLLLVRGHNRWGAVSHA
jgi:hypothetical protein